MNIRPTSLQVVQLLGSPSEQYVIPAYQRRYSWQEKQVWELIDDIKLLDDRDSHLLGSIVCLTGHHAAGVNALELVDGQQRLTTICILLHCIQDRLKQENEHGESQNIQHLLEAGAYNGPAVRKIAMESLDAEEFERYAARRPPERPCNPRMELVFRKIRAWTEEQDVASLVKFKYRLLNQAIIIRLDVSEAKDAFKLFETINNRGLRLSPHDIIKNFVLGNAARFGREALDSSRRSWADLIRHLDGVNFDAFFRYFLSANLKRRVTVSTVIPSFKKMFMQHVLEANQLPDRHWYLDDTDTDDDLEGEVDIGDEGEAPTDIDTAPDSVRVPFATFMEQLVKSAQVYGQLTKGRTGKPQFDRRLRNLSMIKAAQTYGFLMHLRMGGCSDGDFENILRMTEAFVLRRHICRLRSNENETLFARLCGVDCADPLPEVRRTYREHSPSDDRFREDFAATSFNAALIERARYCLEQIEAHHQGSYPELLVAGSDLVHVEHIIPQKIKTKKAKDEFGNWPDYLGPKWEALHSEYVSRIGNLSLFAGVLNMSQSNNPYGRKIEAYRKSAIKVTNSLPDDYPEFTFEAVDRRSEAFAKLAVEVWPIA